MNRCDFRFSLQGRYPSKVDLSAFGITNTAVTIHGFALHAGQGINEDDFINRYSDFDLSEKLKDYLTNRGLDPGPNHLLILDMEPNYPNPAHPDENISFAPRELGDYPEDKRKQLVDAYKLRIRVARHVIQEKWRDRNLKLGLYGVVVPMGKGQDNDEFEKSMQGYRYAGCHGMYDSIDYLVPVLYNRFGKSDVFIPDDGDGKFDIPKLHGWIERATRQAITNSQALSRGNGEVIPLAPVLYLWVEGKNTLHKNKPVLEETFGMQLRILQEYRSVKIIVLWSGPETRREMIEAGLEVIDFKNFMSKVNELPLPGCK